jgi:hypothetical protein
MAVFFGVLGLLVVAVLAARALGLTRVKPWTKYLDKLQTILTLAGIMTAAVWYFFERPQAAKLDVDQHLTAVAIDKSHVMLLAEVSVKNLGDTAIDFRNSPYKIFVTQVTPLTRKVAAEYLSDKGALRPAEQWAPLAKIVFDGRAEAEANGLTSFVEAGETENLYFRVILDCQPRLSVYVMSRFAKPPMWYDELNPLRRKAPQPPKSDPAKDERLYWVKQSFLDLRDVCRGKAGHAESAGGGKEGA